MRRIAVSACLLLAATVALVQQLPAAAPAMPAGGCAASTVRYTPVKHPVFHDEPWLLAAPTAPGVFAHLVTYVPTLREDRVNGSAGAVLWRRGEQIVWSGGAGETAELLARRLDGLRLSVGAGVPNHGVLAADVPGGTQLGERRRSRGRASGAARLRRDARAGERPDACHPGVVRDRCRLVVENRKRPRARVHARTSSRRRYHEGSVVGASRLGSVDLALGPAARRAR